MAEHPRSAQSPFQLAFGSPLMEFHNTVRIDPGIICSWSNLMIITLSPKGKRRCRYVLISLRSVMSTLIFLDVYEGGRWPRRVEGKDGFTSRWLDSNLVLLLLCSHSLSSAFPWKERLSSSEGTRTICDVGAGDGYVTLMLLRELQDNKLRAIVQDRPSFIDLGKQVKVNNFPPSVFYWLPSALELRVSRGIC